MIVPLHSLCPPFLVWGTPPDPRLKAMNYLDSSLRVETLSFEEAADFNPQEWSI
jgi:hypothetical protein